jgi:predicted nucleic acid-binding protein
MEQRPARLRGAGRPSVSPRNQTNSGAADVWRVAEPEILGAYDVLIAGIAWARGHVLATHNVREFGRVAGLQIEDWAAIP